MGYPGTLPYITNPLKEQRRNWILRIRYGPPWLSKRCKSELTESHIHVKGRVMNQIDRLPSIASQGFDSNSGRRQHSNFGSFHSQIEPLQRMRHSTDKIDMPQCAAGARKDAEKKTERTIEQQNTNPCEMLSTENERETNKYWPDIDEVFSEESSSQIETKRSSNKIAWEQKIGHIKEEENRNDAASGANNLPCQLTRKKSNLLENKKVAGNTLKSTHIVIPGTFDNESLRDKSPGKSVPVEQAKILTAETTNCNQRKTSTTTFISKPVKFNFTDVPQQRKGTVLMPSANGTATKSNPGLASGQRTSASKLQRRYSKTGKFDYKSERKKSESGKVKKIPPKPESPPGPSEEEMQELQLPVIRKFLKMPPSRPKVICFDFPGVNLTHNDVKRAIENVVPDAFDQGKIVSVQFENVNVKLATGGKANRWFVELKDFSTRNTLIKKGLTLECANKSNSTTELSLKASSEACTSNEPKEIEQAPEQDLYGPRKVAVRLYDSVSMEEYKLFLRRTAAEEKLQNVILLCAGRGDKLLTNMI